MTMPKPLYHLVFQVFIVSFLGLLTTKVQHNSCMNIESV